MTELPTARCIDRLVPAEWVSEVPLDVITRDDYRVMHQEAERNRLSHVAQRRWAVSRN